ncbi:uncharacterized protein [Aegilops tauschii subsp. strangulata]|uniref:uncharacterized protein n=1 Tax=Aegilops tauschii subsp. strangulata TaxID=200361 RepID=UPI003CC8AB9E
MAVPTMELVRRTQANWLEYLEFFAPNKSKSIPAKWQPPEADVLKINTDGSIIPGQSFSGWGVAARDSEGDVVAAHAGRQEHIHDAFGAEVCAMSAAVTIAAELGAIRVVFETDSQLLVEALDLRKVDSSPYATAIEDIKFQLKMWFSKQSVSYCKREANSVAHELAKIGHMCLPNDCMGWNSIVPPQVAVCVTGDMPGHC